MQHVDQQLVSMKIVLIACTMPRGNGNKNLGPYVANYLRKFLLFGALKFYEDATSVFKRDRAWYATFDRDAEVPPEFVDDLGRSVPMPILRFHELVCNIIKHSLLEHSTFDQASCRPCQRYPGHVPGRREYHGRRIGADT